MSEYRKENRSEQVTRIESDLVCGDYTEVYGLGGSSEYCVVFLLTGRIDGKMRTIELGGR